jgi:predicted NUDIX family NTP pyrophosphohydrolase
MLAHGAHDPQTVDRGSNAQAMASKISAGVLLYRRGTGGVEVFLVHPGGPFWARKDAGAWSIPKGEIEPGEEPLAAARREFYEETGSMVQGTFQALGSVRMRSGKIVFAWACEGEIDPETIRSNVFTMEWPPRSGRQQQFPEADRAAWFPLAEARRRILSAQAPLLDELSALLTGA